MSHTAVFGIYFTREAAEEAVSALLGARFRKSDISALLPENAGTHDLAHERNSKAPEGATTGAAAGVVAGGVLGWLAGIGVLAVPGIGPLIAGGPIVAALAGAGALGIAAGIVGSLIGVGIPEYEARRYEGRVKHGSILLSVHCDSHDWVKRARRILKRTGAEDVSATGEAHADYAVSEKPMPRMRVSITDQGFADEERLFSRAAQQDTRRSDSPDKMRLDEHSHQSEV